MAHGFERERKNKCRKLTREEEEAIWNKIEGHESGLPDLLTGKPVIGQN